VVVLQLAARSIVTQHEQVSEQDKNRISSRTGVALEGWKWLKLPLVISNKKSEEIGLHISLKCALGDL